MWEKFEEDLCDQKNRTDIFICEKFHHDQISQKDNMNEYILIEIKMRLKLF